jgi:hypothetical protein
MYNAELKLAVEYNGMQHYEPIEFFGGKEAFELRTKYDEEKMILCRENSVKLIIVPYTVKQEDIHSFLKEQTRMYQPEYVEKSDDEADEFCTQTYKQEELRELVEDRRGEILSGVCVTGKSRIVLRCDKGHQWCASVHNIRTGMWCNQCDLGSKTKISVSLKKYNATENGKEKKKLAHAKRSETMAKQREEIRAQLTEKECRKCKTVKPVTEYGSRVAGKDGLQSYCKPCQKLAKTEWKRNK